jgi:hypothetical protein
MSVFVSSDDRVSLRVHDILTGREQLEPSKAALIARQVRDELRQDTALKELFVVRIKDFAGAPHAVVARTVSPNSTALFRFDIAGLRRRARQELAEEWMVDARVEDDGTEV